MGEIEVQRSAVGRQLVAEPARPALGDSAQARVATSGTPANVEPTTSLATALRRCVRERADARLGRPVLQRKAQLRPPEGVALTGSALVEYLQSKPDLFPKDARINEITAEMVNIALRRLTESSTDYGSFDLSNDVDLKFFFYELRKELVAPKVPEPTAATGPSIVDYRAQTNAPEQTYELAFLGAGAAVAYYMTTSPEPIDKATTVVIGPVQPWREERGPGKINHPMHMIAPQRERVGLDDEALAPRGEFSSAVEDVIRRHADTRHAKKIEKLTKKQFGDAWMYEIVEEGGQLVYARRIISALGIGKHKKSPGVGGEQPDLGGLAMDLDAFQNLAPRLPDGPDTTVIVTGPNAGIDAISTALRKKFTVIWITGATGEPQLLPGTDNEAVKKEYDRAASPGYDEFLTELRQVRGTRERKMFLELSEHKLSAIERVVRARAGQARLTSGGEKRKGTVAVDLQGGAGTLYGDFFVYAFGPDTPRVQGVFDASITLEPVYDISRSFGDELGLGTVIGLEAARTGTTDLSSLEIIGGSVFRFDIGYDYVQRQWKWLVDDELVDIPLQLAKRTEPSDALTRLLAALDHARRGVADLRKVVMSHVKTIDEAATRTKLTFPTLEVGSALTPLTSLSLSESPLEAERARLAVHIRKIVDSCVANLKQYHDAFARYQGGPGDPRKTSGQMGNVVASLPHNVAINDQLAPIRSQVEARAAFVPGYVRSDVNYAVDDINVLQVHISVRFPHISDTDIDAFVRQIIKERRPKEHDPKTWNPRTMGPLPNPLKVDQDKRETATMFNRRFAAALQKADEEAKSKLGAVK